MEQTPTVARRVEVALVVVLTAVEEVDGLAPDVGVGLVHRARLPLVDQAGGVLGVGVAPLVGDDVVGGDAVAVVGGRRRSSWRWGS